MLLWKIGALGDVLMTTPLVRQLRRGWPQARIEYLVGQASRAAIEGNPQLDAVRSFDDATLFRTRPAGLPAIVRALRGYDAVFVLDKHWIFALLAGAAGAPLRIGFRRRAVDAMGLTRHVPYGALRHEVHAYLDLAEAAGLPVDRDDLALEFGGAVAADLAPGTTVLVNSGGANPHEDSSVRRMPDPLFAGLVQACAAQGPVAFLGSAAEAAYYERFAGPATTNLCGRTSIREAAGALRSAARVITTDTGLMHLAAAVNPRVLAVFGPTHPARKCPPGAQWVWRDALRYDAAYEVSGRVPRARFFETMQVEHILHAAGLIAPTHG